MSSLLSLDVGHGNFHMVEGNYIKGTIQVDRAVTWKIPAQCFNGDIVENKDLFTDTLHTAILSAGFASKEVVITLNAFDAIVREIVLPNAKPKEIAAMIKNELIQTYHADSADVIQYKGIGKEVNEHGVTMYRYRAAALDPEFIDTYHQVLVGAKLKPVAMDLNFNAMDKLLTGDSIVNDKIMNGNATMFLDFGEALLTVYIVSSGKPIFHRHINIGCGEIERMIYRDTFAPEDEIRKLKEDGYNFFGNNPDDKYYNTLRPYFYHMVDEIRKIIGFYTSRPGAESIDQIYLFGGGSNMTGISEYFESNFNIPTEKIEKILKVKFKNTATPIVQYMNAVGALIRL